jgi:hypothetical protein
MKTYENKIIEYFYKETQIHFLINPLDKNVMINATEMAKIFGKRTDHYLQNESTKTFIKALKVPEISGTLGTEIIENRGRNGIYFNEILALDFAAWLDVKFKVWVYTTIRDLLQKDFKKITSTVKEVTSKENRLQELVNKIQNSDNKDAKDLLDALSDLEAAKKSKTRAVSELTKQIKIQFC